MSNVQTFGMRTFALAMQKEDTAPRRCGRRIYGSNRKAIQFSSIDLFRNMEAARSSGGGPRDNVKSFSTVNF